MNVYVRSYRALAAWSWEVRREVDDRLEAAGFGTRAQAEDWAASMGYRILRPAPGAATTCDEHHNI